jgi:hypothetical protein
MTLEDDVKGDISNLKYGQKIDNAYKKELTMTMDNFPLIPHSRKLFEDG